MYVCTYIYFFQKHQQSFNPGNEVAPSPRPWCCHKEKHTIREISEKMKRSKSVVGRVVKSYNDTGKIVSAFKTLQNYF